MIVTFFEACYSISSWNDSLGEGFCHFQLKLFGVRALTIIQMTQIMLVLKSLLYWLALMKLYKKGDIKFFLHKAKEK